MRKHEHTPVVWRKSSRSFAGNECVEVAFAGDGRVWVRDSKLEAEAPVMSSTLHAWRDLIAEVKSQRFDH